MNRTAAQPPTASGTPSFPLQRLPFFTAGLSAKSVPEVFQKSISLVLVFQKSLDVHWPGGLAVPALRASC